MPFVTCLCGKQLDGADAEALNDAFWSHTGSAHPDVKVSDAKRADVKAAILRTGGWDGRRAELAEPVEIRPLAPATREDYLQFFDGAFPDNPVWASCYCLSYHLQPTPGEIFDERPAAQNRAERAEMIDRGEASGVMAYSAGRVAGWCNASPRIALPLLDQYPEFAADDPATSAAVVCFVIAPHYRGQGLARKLLDGACDMFRERGFTMMYGYPPKQASSAAGSYHGKLSMYLDAGFEETGAATSRYVVVRKTLA
ncbi:MAG TPA: GNAT family N-acetyltransferase [Dehalococcoidia bacterium]|nr:GNAT family N-acetyltransferase [Dehalococcoidia bacterium]